MIAAREKYGKEGDRECGLGDRCLTFKCANKELLMEKTAGWQHGWTLRKTLSGDGRCCRYGGRVSQAGGVEQHTVTVCM